MRYLLDTNIVSELIGNPQGRVADRIRDVGEAQVATSIIVAAELRYGAAKKRSPRLTAQVEAVLGAMAVARPVATAAAPRTRIARRASDNAGSKFVSATAHLRRLRPVLHFEREGQTVANVDDQHLAFSHLLEEREQLFRLLLQQEVIEAVFWAGRVVAAHLQLADDARRRTKNRNAPAHLELFNAAEVDLLHQLDQSPLRPRKGGFRSGHLHRALLVGK